MHSLSAVALLLVGAEGIFRCTNECGSSYNNVCEDGTQLAVASSCACGTDCSDCGVQDCPDADDDEYDCGSGYRTCEDSGAYWCCDRSSDFPKCGDSWGYCTQGTSKKTKKTVSGVLIAIAVIIPLSIIAGIIACCFCCVGCPGYKATHKAQNNHAPPQHINGPPIAIVTTTHQGYAPQGYAPPPQTGNKEFDLHNET